MPKGTYCMIPFRCLELWQEVSGGSLGLGVGGGWAVTADGCRVSLGDHENAVSLTCEQSRHHCIVQFKLVSCSV